MRTGLWHGSLKYQHHLNYFNRGKKMNKYLSIVAVGILLTVGSVWAIDGKNGDFRLSNEADRVLGTMVTSQYRNREFALPGGASDYDLQANQSVFDATFTRAHYISIRTDADISIKFNSITNDAITIGPGESPFQIDRLEYNNVFLSSTPGANVKIWVQ